MGLSRVIKIPYKRGVGDVAGELYGMPGRYRAPKLRDHFDFARAVFGVLDLNEDAEGGPRDRGRPQADVDALAGRVAISPAFSDLNPNTIGAQTFIFGQPRESFYKFYLTGNYHGGAARPAGRKRYPARQAAVPPTVEPDPSNRTQSRVAFHAPGTRYVGRIRVHNLHPVELGALVWCLTFGKAEGPWHHQIGRAKAYGYGRISLRRLGWRQGSFRAVNLPVGCDPDDRTSLAQEFVRYMDQALGEPFLETRPIRLLRGYANPAAATIPPQRDRLAYPEVEKFKDLSPTLGQSETWEQFGE